MLKQGRKFNKSCWKPKKDCKINLKKALRKILKNLLKNLRHNINKSKVVCKIRKINKIILFQGNNSLFKLIKNLRNNTANIKKLSKNI